MSERNESTGQSGTVPDGDASETCKTCGGPLRSEHLWCPGGHSETGNGQELATGGFIENIPLLGKESGHEYLVRDEPLKTRWMDTAIDGAEQVTAEALSKAMDTAADQIVAIGGFIPDGHLAISRDTGPEFVSMPPGGKVIPNSNATIPDVALEGGTKFTYTINGWPANNPTLLNPNPGGLAYGWNSNATWINPAYSQPVTYHIPPPPAITEERICELVTRAVHKALYGESDGLVDTRHHRRVTLHEDGGDEWSGILYKREKESEM